MENSANHVRQSPYELEEAAKYRVGKGKGSFRVNTGKKDSSLVADFGLFQNKGVLQR